MAAKNGAAARLAKIKRATAHAFDDLGQRKKFGPSAGKSAESSFLMQALQRLQYSS
jgi:hypothetical protein